MTRRLMLLSLLLLAACGFEPVYGVHRGMPVGGEEKLGQVDIGNIPDREGQYLRNALIDRFYRDSRPADPQYFLAMEPVYENLTDLDITKTADATRGQLRLDTTITLTDRNSTVLLTRPLRATTSYNKLASEFSTRVAEENARTNALDEIARQIEMQLTLYFKRI
ncbi:MAG: LPS assembly lipoprotein LptE [Alphaproteobacteria bacterium]